MDVGAAAAAAAASGGEMTVRYTANKVYPQCALYAQEGLPAYPFKITVGRRAVPTTTAASPRPDRAPLTFSDMFLGAEGTVPVVQRGVAAPVWGSAPAGTKVRVFLDGKEAAAAVSNSSGVWLAHLPQQPAGYNRTLTAKSAAGSAQTTVSFGEVVLCVGQSNMGMQVGPSVRGFDADNATAEGAAAGRYSGRIALHARDSRWEAAKGVSMQSTMWYDVDPVSIKNFSAVSGTRGGTCSSTSSRSPGRRCQWG